jgi:uncharacterized protein YbjT (DUF2867 family)
MIETSMKTGVSGAGGRLGRAVVAHLLRRADGHGVAAISRTPDTAVERTRRRFGDYARPLGSTSVMQVPP